MNIRIIPPEEIIETSIQLPLSKSESNRALIMSALTANAPIQKVAKCDDTDAMLNALAVDVSGDQPAEINVGLAGTAMRFLTAYFAATKGAHVRLDGNERMRQRPIGVLVDALRSCGADIQYLGNEGFPPLLIKGRQLNGKTIEMDASVSSQFLSALLMVAPTMDAPMIIVLKGHVASMPYLNMTIEMMSRRGIVINKDLNQVTIQPGQYKPCSDNIEPDWSAASYWYEIAALTSGWVTLPGLKEKSLQGDRAIADIFEKLGVVTEFTDEGAELSASPEMFSRLEVDLSDNPDLAQTLAVTCCLLGVPFRLGGLRSLKIKETDRLEALRNELMKLSFVVDIENDDILSWENERMPIASVPPIATYGDHRMAMAFAPVSAFLPGLGILDAQVVSKSYPNFWHDLESAGFTFQEF